MLIDINWHFGDLMSPSGRFPLRLWPDDDDHAVVMTAVGGNVDDGSDLDIVLAVRLDEGIYEASNLHNWLRPDYCNLEYVSIDWLDLDEVATLLGARSTYGVADTVDQVRTYFQQQIADPLHHYVIAVYPIFKRDQPPTGGWRWTKYSAYIGTQQRSGAEYLFDEPEIDTILLKQQYRVLVAAPHCTSGPSTVEH